MKKSSAFSIIVATAIAAAEALAFDVTGQVLGISRSVQGWILLAGGAEPANFAFETGTLPECRSGDIVKANGRQKINQYGEMLFKCVRIRGVISAVNRDDTNTAWTQLTLRTPGVGIIRKAPEDPFNAPPLTDRLALYRQRIEGIVVAADRHRIYLATEATSLAISLQIISV